MIESNTAANHLSLKLDQLFADRAMHTAALGRIDQTLLSIESLLGGSSGAVGNGSPVTKPVRSALSALKKRRGPGTYAATATETVLAFVESHRQAATAEINAHWKKVGRMGTADNTLTTLVKARKLRRQHIAGRRGSVYSIA